MIKALFRKQFSELISQFFRGRRGAERSKNGGAVLFLVVYAVVFISLGVSFFSFSKTILEKLTPATYPVFYLVIGLVATAIGMLGSVFNAYATIFEAKDNEMLLSLPIPPSRIIFVRVTSLSAMSLLYDGAILLPSFIAFVSYADVSAFGAANAFFLFLPLTLLVSALSLGLAFLVAAASHRVKNKKTVVLVVSLLMVALFYYLYFRAQNMVSSLTQSDEIPVGIRYGLFFFYGLGLASTGDPAGLGIAYGTAIAAFALAYFLLTKTFLKFTTAKRNAALKSKKEAVRAGSLRAALFRREWKLFTSSPNYVLNCSFGVLFLIALAIFAIIRADLLKEASSVMNETMPGHSGAAVAALIVMLTVGMNDITAPSISMEGKKITLIRSLPVDPMRLFLAKIAVHLAVVVPPTLFTSVTLSVIFGADLFGAIMIPIVCLAYALFTACVGLCLNVVRPVLDWKDETMAVKTGLSVFLSIFGSILLLPILGGLYFLLAYIMPDGGYLLVLTAILLGASWALLRWLATRGKARFERLG